MTTKYFFNSIQKRKKENETKRMTMNKGEIEWKEFEKVLEGEGVDSTVITSEKVFIFYFYFYFLNF